MSASTPHTIAKNHATRDLVAKHRAEWQKLYRQHTKALGLTPRKLAPHGTLAAYQRHIRHGETACRPCKNAMRDYSRATRGAAL